MTKAHTWQGVQSYNNPDPGEVSGSIPCPVEIFPFRSFNLVCLFNHGRIRVADKFGNKITLEILKTVVQLFFVNHPGLQVSLALFEICRSLDVAFIINVAVHLDGVQRNLSNCPYLVTEKGRRRRGSLTWVYESRPLTTSQYILILSLA